MERTEEFGSFERGFGDRWAYLIRRGIGVALLMRARSPKAWRSEKRSAHEGLGACFGYFRHVDG